MLSTDVYLWTSRDHSGQVVQRIVGVSSLRVAIRGRLGYKEISASALASEIGDGFVGIILGTGEQLALCVLSCKFVTKLNGSAATGRRSGEELGLSVPSFNLFVAGVKPLSLPLPMLALESKDIGDARCVRFR